ncbi:hypothetical protein [Streptomyces sp. NPDC086777]|uniref:hypothetical protein n=1 Tax=Streptomyces sp. NPDC086777 TaxID=3154866 RepID=UPI00344C87AD
MTSDQNFGVWGGRTEAERRSGTEVNRRHGVQSDEKGQAFIGSAYGLSLTLSGILEFLSAAA